MKERCIAFGVDRHLMGVLCEPAAAPRPAGSPSVLMWNAGPLHHVGAHRMNVEVARRLAARGVTSLRFDISGLGDSSQPQSVAPTRDHAVADVRAAMDAVAARTRNERFILIGLCSSADTAHRVAKADPRVSGAVLIDGYVYPTLRCRLRHVVSMLCSPRRLFGFAGRKARRLSELIRGTRSEVPSEEDTFAWDMPPKEEAAVDLQALVDRNVRLLYVFSGEYPRQYNYAGQFEDMYRGVQLRGLARARFLDDCDHTFSQLDGRRRLVDLVTEWVVGPCAGAPPAGG